MSSVLGRDRQYDDLHQVYPPMYVIHADKNYLQERNNKLGKKLQNILSVFSRIWENKLHGLGTRPYYKKRQRRGISNTIDYSHVILFGLVLSTVENLNGLMQKYLTTSENTTNQNSEDTEELLNYIEKLREENTLLRKLIETCERELARYKNPAQQQHSESSSGEDGRNSDSDESIVSSSDCPPVIDDPPSRKSFVQGLVTNDVDDRLNSTAIGENIGKFVIIETNKRHSVSKIIDENVIDGEPPFTVELYKPKSRNCYTFVPSGTTCTVTEKDIKVWLEDPSEMRSGLKFPFSSFNTFRIHD